jgi:hypothetical protein
VSVAIGVRVGVAGTGVSVVAGVRVGVGGTGVALGRGVIVSTIREFAAGIAVLVAACLPLSRTVAVGEAVAVAG